MNMQNWIKTGGVVLAALTLAACSGGGAGTAGAGGSPAGAADPFTAAAGDSPQGAGNPFTAAAGDAPAAIAPTQNDQVGAPAASPVTTLNPTTNPTLIETDTAGDQQDPALACNAIGQCVVAWDSVGEDGSLDGIYARRLTAQGVPVGAPFQVNTYTNGRQMKPAVGIDAGGNFVVAWISTHQELAGMTVWARRYASNADPLGAPFRVDASDTFNRSVYPQMSLAVGSSGGFVVAWEERAPVLGGLKLGFIVTRTYTSNGTPQSGPRTIAFGLDPLPRVPQVAMDTQGAYVVVWDSAGSGLLGAKGTQALQELGDAVGSLVPCPMVYGTLLCTVGGLGVVLASNPLDALGSMLQIPVGAWVGLLLGNGGLGAVGTGLVAGLSNGLLDAGGLLTGLGIQAQFFSPAGIATSPPMTLAKSGPFRKFDRPAVATNAVGKVVIGWQASHTDGTPMGVSATVYSFTGGGKLLPGTATREVFPFQAESANESQPSLQRQPSVAIDRAGNLAVAGTGSSGIHLWRASASWFEPGHGAVPSSQWQRPVIYPIDATQPPPSLLNPVVTMAQVGQCLMAWQRYTAGPQGRDVVVAPCPSS